MIDSAIALNHRYDREWHDFEQFELVQSHRPTPHSIRFSVEAVLDDKAKGMSYTWSDRLLGIMQEDEELQALALSLFGHNQNMRNCTKNWYHEKSKSYPEPNVLRPSLFGRAGHLEHVQGPGERGHTLPAPPY